MLTHHLRAPLVVLALLSALPGAAQATLTSDGATITVQAGATLYVAGTVNNNAASSLTNAGTVQLTGDLTNAGTLASSGTLLFSGTTNQTFTPGAATVSTLVLNNTGPVGQRTLALPADLTVSTSLTLQSGLLRTAPTATLTLPDGATLSGEGPGQYVQGNLKVVRAAGAGVLDFGHGLLLDRTGLGQVTANRTAGLLTDNLSRGVNLGNTSLKGIDRIWTVETASTPPAATPIAVTLQWIADDDNGLTSFAQTQAWRAALGSAQWLAVGTQQPAVVAAGRRSFSFDTPALGRLTVSNAANPLPVELTTFTAQPAVPTAVRLAWATASEKNSNQFDVERSPNGNTFEKVGEVAAAGNSSAPRTYGLTDATLPAGARVLYYRLRQVDQDGTATYSPVRTVKLSPALADHLILWPNPARTAVQVAGLPAAAPLQVLDALGRIVAQAAADDVGTARLALPQGLAAGVYVVRGAGQTARLTVE